MRKQACFEDIANKIQPGDLIAFGGTSLFSRWAKLTTWSNVTHVGAVSNLQYCEHSGDLLHHDLFEATVRQNKRGVMVNRLVERVDEYEGDIWWLPLKPSFRQRFKDANKKVQDFMHAEDKKAYDIWQLFGSTVDFFDQHPWLRWLTWNAANRTSWFCSELIADLYNHAGILKQVNPSETTPIDLCRFNIFGPEYYQLKGEETEIRLYNTTEPDGWGQLLEEENRPQE